MTSISINNVIDSKLCVGCGACAVATNSQFKVSQNKLGYFEAQSGSASRESQAIASKVCPFSNDSANENSIARDQFSSLTQHDPRIGLFSSISAGRVTQGEDVRLSSSGGLTSWLTLKLMEANLIDGVIHVASGGTQGNGPLFEYVISNTSEELRSNRKSQYYSTTLADVLTTIRGNGKKYALVGVPCFIKAARLLARQDALIKEQLAFCIGLVCGHLKSSGFAELLAWQVGVAPQELVKVDFRVKESGKSAGDYGFSAWSRKSQEPATMPTRSLLGGNWGHALFQMKACDFCDDIFAETADITFGDAWLPQYSDEWRGTNVIVSRNSKIDDILQTGVETNEIWLETISPDLAAKSQDGNYRHRWDGLSLRLSDDIKAGLWVPIKRIRPGSRPVRKRRANIIRLRRKLAAESHQIFFEAKAAKSLDLFSSKVNPIINAMDAEYKADQISPIRHLIRKTKRILLSIFR